MEHASIIRQYVGPVQYITIHRQTLLLGGSDQHTVNIMSGMCTIKCCGMFVQMSDWVHGDQTPVQTVPSIFVIIIKYLKKLDF